MEAEFLRRLADLFPRFAAKLGDGSRYYLEQVQPPATDKEIEQLEQHLGLLLPESYKALLKCGREFWLMGETTVTLKQRKQR